MGKNSVGSSIADAKKCLGSHGPDWAVCQTLSLSLKLREEMMLMVRLGGHVTNMVGEEWSKEVRPASMIHTLKAGEGEARFLL